MVFKIINIGSNPIFLVCSILSRKRISLFSFVYLKFFFKFIFFFLKSLIFFRFGKLKGKNFINQTRREFHLQGYLLLDLVLILYFTITSKINQFKNSAIKYKFDQIMSKFYRFCRVKVFENKSVLLGLKYLWMMLRFWALGVCLFIAISYYFMYIRSLPVSKILFQWIVVIMIVYWLMSGFVFFIKKYRYSKYTTAIQRFWRRSFMIFWLIESFLFLIFIYLTVNANQEPVYMYDNLQIYKTHLFSWRMFLLKIVPVTIVVITMYFLLLFVKWGVFSKSDTIVFFITLLLIYIVWLEFYQFFHVLNYYGNLMWVYDSEEHLWFLEPDFKKTRIVNHYLTICIIAKFWHLIFIFVFWIFFILRSIELTRYRFPLLSANLQNFVILYILSWIGMYPWFKFVFRRYLENPYFWLYTSPRKTFVKMFFNDLKLIYLSLLEIFENVKSYFHFEIHDYFYWHNTSSDLNFCQYEKHIVRDKFINFIS